VKDVLLNKKRIQHLRQCDVRGEYGLPLHGVDVTEEALDYEAAVGYDQWSRPSLIILTISSGSTCTGCSL
jgi:hypothetical protein